VGFGRACAHPSFWAHRHGHRGAARPVAHRSFAAFSLYSKNKNNLPNLGRPREGLLHIFQIYHWGQRVYRVPGLLSSRPNWVPPPSTARECCHFRMRGWVEPIFPTMGHTLWYYNHSTTEALKYNVPWPPPITSQLRWSFWLTINRKKPQKITVWGSILRYQWYVEKTPRNILVWQKIRQSIPKLI
jgi:hypothetical protein